MVEGRFKASKSKIASYDEVLSMLDSTGVTFYSDGKVEPLTYMGYRIVACVAGFAIGFFFNIFLGLVFAVVAFKLPDMYVTRRNERDNKDMIQDIIGMYDILCLQLSGNEHISNIIIAMYRAVSHPRLKIALLELTGDIVSSNDILLSVEVFARKFRNENLDSLVKVVKQICSTGSSLELANDIKKNMVLLQDVYNANERSAIQRRTFGITVLIFIAIIMLLIYSSSLGLGSISSLLLM